MNKWHILSIFIGIGIALNFTWQRRWDCAAWENIKTLFCLSWFRSTWGVKYFQGCHTLNTHVFAKSTIKIVLKQYRVFQTVHVYLITLFQLQGSFDYRPYRWILFKSSKSFIPLLKYKEHVSSLIGNANNFTSQWKIIECLKRNTKSHTITVNPEEHVHVYQNLPNQIFNSN